MMGANNAPDFHTIPDSCKDHLEALASLFGQVLALCRRAGLVKLGPVALDVARVRNSASKHQAMNHGRVKEKETQLEVGAAELLRRADDVDENEDRR